MLVVTAALQVSEQIKDAGAYAGLASILGLAVLSLLYFGQARELKRLRDWAGRAPERTADLQAQADAAAAVRARRVVPQPVAAAPPVRRPAQAPATAAGAAVRTAGSVAAAAPAAGKAASSAGAPSATSRAAAPATAGPGTAAAPATPGSAASATAAPAAPGSATPGTSSAATPGSAGTPSTPGTATAPNSAPGNGAPPAGPRSQETQSIPAVNSGPPTPAAAKPPSAAPAAPSLPPAVPSVVAPTPIGPSPPPTGDTPVPLRQASAATGAPRRRGGVEAPPPAVHEDAGKPSGRTVGIVVGAVAVLLLVAVLATQVLGGGDDPAPGSSAGTATTSTDNTFVPPPSSGSRDPATPSVAPDDVSVYVLNATVTNGLAAEVAKSLEIEGYESAGTGTAAASTAPTTEVFHLEGKKRAALAVAKTLDVNAANVKPVTRAIEVQGPNADVIVQMGADKATP